MNENTTRPVDLAQEALRQPDCLGDQRALVYRFQVQPGLWVAVEDSHCLLLQITTLDGSTEIARSGTLSNGDDISRAVELARVWVARAGEDADAERRCALAARMNERRSPRSGRT